MLLNEIKAKLLIVDDLPENLLALEALIKREDRQVFKALSADEALSLLLEHEFAMAILDVQMPGMNGFELAELMRGTEKTKNIPIVFVSAAGALGDASAVICALELNPTQLRIADQIAVAPDSGPARAPETAAIRNGQIVAEPWAGRYGV